MNTQITNIQKDYNCLQGQNPALYEQLENDLREKQQKLETLWNGLDQIENGQQPDMNMNQIVNASGFSTTRSGAIYNRMGGSGGKNKKKIFRGGANKWVVRALVWLTIAIGTGASIATIYFTAEKMGIIKVLQNAVNLADFTVQGCGSAQGIAARNTANSWFSYFSSNASPDVTCSNAVFKLEQAQNALQREINVVRKSWLCGYFF